MPTANKSFCLRCLSEVAEEIEKGGLDTCPNCLGELRDYQNIELTAKPFDSYTPELLAAVLDVLEIVPFRDLDAAALPSQHALRIAKRLGAPALEMRALLIQADILSRQGQIAEGGRIFHEVNTWAAQHGHIHVLARSHRLLSGFFRRVGDNASAFEHAARALEYTPDTAPSHIRADHLLALTNTLDENGAHDESARRFQEILDLAAATNDIHLSLISLNNMAVTRCELGDADAALQLVTKLRSLAEEHDVPLDAASLDTIARVEILLGRPADAVRTMQPIVQDLYGRLTNELAVLPECLLTYTEALRLQGLFDEAQATLDQTQKLCEQYNLTASMVNVRLEQSKLFAAAGRYREAYEEHCRFHRETETLRANERDARARILQAVFDVKEARRDIEHFREMALRDSLTGLHNRRYIDTYIDTLLEGTADIHSITAAILDIDHFKRINDTRSHAIGDAVLVHFASILTSQAGEHAAVARLGGEEFVVVFKNISEEESQQRAEQLRQAVRSADWTPITGGMDVTVSIGVGVSLHKQVSRYSLFSQADQNLYKAKRFGRDNVVVSVVR